MIWFSYVTNKIEAKQNVKCSWFRGFSHIHIYFVLPFLALCELWRRIFIEFIKICCISGVVRKFEWNKMFAQRRREETKFFETYVFHDYKKWHKLHWFITHVCYYESRAKQFFGGQVWTYPDELWLTKRSLTLNNTVCRRSYYFSNYVSIIMVAMMGSVSKLVYIHE